MYYSTRRPSTLCMVRLPMCMLMAAGKEVSVWTGILQSSFRILLPLPNGDNRIFSPPGPRLLSRQFEPARCTASRRWLHAVKAV